jgi:hypothetical protein
VREFLCKNGVPLFAVLGDNPEQELPKCRDQNLVRLLGGIDPFSKISDNDFPIS